MLFESGGVRRSEWALLPRRVARLLLHWGTHGDGADGALAQQPVHLVLLQWPKAAEAHIVEVELLGAIAGREEG